MGKGEGQRGGGEGERATEGGRDGRGKGIGERGRTRWGGEREGGGGYRLSLHVGIIMSLKIREGGRGEICRWK